MKTKLLFLQAIICFSFLLLPTFAFGWDVDVQPLGTTKNPLPEFNVTIYGDRINFFEESITVIDAYVMDIRHARINVTQMGPPIIASDGYSEKYQYAISQYLSNGNYSFFINAIDQYGNTKNATATFEIFFDYLGIYLKKPKLGIANATPFDVLIETEDSVLSCRMGGRYGGNITNRTQLASVYGTLNNMTFLNPEKTLWYYNLTEFTRSESYWPYWFICTYLQSNNYQLAEYALGFDTTPTTITVFPENPKVTDSLLRYVNLAINTSDASICSITNLKNNVMIYRDAPSLDTYALYVPTRSLVLDDFSDEIQYSGNFIRLYEISCTNLAGFTTTKQFSVEVNISNSLAITRITPENIQTKNVNFQVKTNVIAEYCKSGNTMFTTTDKLTFSLPLTNLEEGEHTIDVYCKTAYQKEASESFRIFVDTTKPTRPTINAGQNSCSLSHLSADFEAEDNESGIARFNFSLYQGTTKVYGWALSSSENPAGVSLTNLDLIDGKTYTWKVYAIDKSGNVGEVNTKDVFVANPRNNSRCDSDPPDASINIITRDAGRVRLNMSCHDDESGCAWQYNYSRNRDSSGTCNYTQHANLDFVHTFDQTELFCYKVFDQNNNTRTGREVIHVEQRPGIINLTNGTNATNLTRLLCTNGYRDTGEADVDCGGVCPNLCDTGKRCTISFDCYSAYCDANICKIPSCSDAKKNGRETDVDCGGNCTAKCAINKLCMINADCAQGLICGNNLCIIDPALDTDKNGLPDAWEYKYFNRTTGTNPNDDQDRDGANNLAEYKSGTNPLDKNSHPEHKSVLPLILLILGILLVVGGIAYLLLKKSPPKTEQPIFVQNTVEKEENPELPSEEAQKTNMIASRMFKKRTTQKTLIEKKKLFSSFDEQEAKKEDIKPLETVEVKKIVKEESKDQLKDKKSKKSDAGKSEEYVELSALKDKDQLQKQDTKKQVFQRLEGLAKQSKTKPVVEKTTVSQAKPEDTSSQEKSVKTELPKSTMSKKEVFDKLAELSKQSKQKVQTVMKENETMSVKKMMDIFANVTDKKQINQDVFKVIISELLAMGKLDKKTVSEMLFKFMDQKLLTKKEVATIMKDLKLM